MMPFLGRIVVTSWILLLTCNGNGHPFSPSPTFLPKTGISSGLDGSTSTAAPNNYPPQNDGDDSFLQCNNNNQTITGEVVGASGRMGSYWIQAAAACASPQQQQNLIPVPRGVAPGSLSSTVGIPILVNTPSSSWTDIYHQTVPNRTQDLVWIGNGLLSDNKLQQDHSTVVIPHYGILQVFGKPITSPLSPPTYIYGKHAIFAKQLLEQSSHLKDNDSDNTPTTGIQTEIVTTFQEMKIHAARKLLWASCMWLFCHYDNDNPITLETVHQIYASQLEQLLAELAPAFHELISKDDNDDDDITTIKDYNAWIRETLEYMKRYSLSMPHAITKKESALDELPQRNGVFLALRDKYPQPFHQELIANAVGKRILNQIVGEVTTTPQNKSPQKDLVGENSLQRIPFEESSNNSQHELLVICRSIVGTPNTTTTQRKKVVVVGAGMMGTSIALNLARRGITNITVVDHHRGSLYTNSKKNNDDDDNESFGGLETTNLGGSSSSGLRDDNDTNGATTPASWAWLNANGKSPTSYQRLNQLGMHYWKHCDSLLQNLPVWNGALVGYEVEPSRSFGPQAGYPMEGPLSLQQIRKLDPHAQFANTDHVYYFPSEGYVDPTKAVQTLREEAQEKGVRFVFDTEIINITVHKDDDTTSDNQHQPQIKGVFTKSTKTQEIQHMAADLVVVAAGTGSSASIFGGLPMLHRPGQIAFVKPSPSSSSDSAATTSSGISRVLVDTVRKSHVLQRQDGTLVIGGGDLEVGGSSATSRKGGDGDLFSPTSPTKSEKSSNNHPMTSSFTNSRKEWLYKAASKTLVESAKMFIPTVMDKSSLWKVEEAVRPIPQDGLPAIGYINDKNLHHDDDDNNNEIRNSNGKNRGLSIYVAVTHSGMTLGPLIGALVACEIAENVSCELLNPFRPTRFFSDNGKTHTTE